MRKRWLGQICRTDEKDPQRCAGGLVVSMTEFCLTLLKAYSDAQTLGYLSTFSREEVDILTLNPDKYYTPKGLPEPPKAGG